MLADIVALVALYESTNGSTWGESLGEWHGVKTAVIGGRVTELKLDLRNYRKAGYELIGKIPPELDLLTGLKTLNLENNQLSGEIPPELGNLTSLTELLLNGNGLSGKIPPELGNLIALTKLYLRDNQLGGEMPLELGNLVNVRGYISDSILHGNQFTGCVAAGHGDYAPFIGARAACASSQKNGLAKPELGVPSAPGQTGTTTPGTGQTTPALVRPRPPSRAA